MAYTKEKLYNLTLSALLLAKEVTNVETDKSNEVRVLNIHWDTALESTLKDLNLDSLSTRVTLELLENLTDDKYWAYLYRYPANCILLRRLDSGALTDTSATLVDKAVRIVDGVKVIYSNDTQSVAEIIPANLPLSALSANTAMAIAYKLAFLSAPLVTGKGSSRLRQELMQAYVIFKTEAQNDDALENERYVTDEERSEFVSARMS